MLWAASWAEQAAAQTSGAIDPDPEVTSEVRDPSVYWEVPLVHTFGLMTGMRTFEAIIWPQPFAETEPLDWAYHYGEAFTRPPKWDSSQSSFEWDGDPWYVNVIGHGLLGSELYMRSRVCRHDPVASLLFAAGTTAMWDYVFEGNAVRPSGLDLWYTPLAGFLLGEVRYVAWRAASSIGDVRWRVPMTLLLDPFGEIERALGTPC